MAKKNLIAAFKDIAAEELARVAGGTQWTLTSTRGGGIYFQSSDGPSVRITAAAKDGPPGERVELTLPRGFSGSLAIHEPGLDFSFNGRIG
jgi:hypothetical protein